MKTKDLGRQIHVRHARRRKSNERAGLFCAASYGFTLLELVIAIAVIAILAALLAPTIMDLPDQARHARAKSDVQLLAAHIERMKTDTLSVSTACLVTLTNLAAPTCPATCGPLMACSANDYSYSTGCWSGPYFTAINPDPWGTPYVASYDPNSLTITATSAGPDGLFNTSDDITATQ